MRCAECWTVPVHKAKPQRTGAAGRAGRGRLAPAEGGLRAVQQQVLRSFASTGRAPPASCLGETAARHDTTANAILGELHAADFFRLGPGGEIRIAYPFSAEPTPHLVRIAGRTQVYAMCAIDALGIAAMLGTMVAIVSTDPHTGESVTLSVAAGGTTAMWQPAAAVVFYGVRASCDPGGSADGTPAIAAEVCCDHINFFTSQASAISWAGTHSEITGQVLDQSTALRLGTEIFGPLLVSP
jgi:hypothetical protein